MDANSPLITLVSAVNVHPTPTAFAIGSTTAVPAAPSKHRDKFNAAAADAPLLGKTSTRNVVITL